MKFLEDYRREDLLCFEVSGWGLKSCSLFNLCRVLIFVCLPCLNFPESVLSDDEGIYGVNVNIVTCQLIARASVSHIVQY